jgi:serralysin
MAGRSGSDFYYVDSSFDVVAERLGEGESDTIFATVSFRLRQNVENLELRGEAARGFGNELDNSIVVRSSEDTGIRNFLDGGAGADLMAGGKGNDVYLVDNAGDVIEEADIRGPGSKDLVRSTVSYTLAPNVEILELVGAGAQDGTGHEFGNTIRGNDFANVLRGLGGFDRLHGGGGDDTLYGNEGADWMYGGDGDDTFYTGGFNAAGDDLGNDSMTGGAGADKFVFLTVNNTGFGDSLEDFTPADDTILLRAIWGGIGEGELDPDQFVIGRQAQGAEDRVIFSPIDRTIWFDFDGSGAGGKFALAFVPEGVTVDHTDFVGYG